MVIDGSTAGSKKRRVISLTDDEDSEPAMYTKCKSKKKQEVLFACPYYKRYHRYGQSCPDKGWPSVARLKGHLYRHHRQPIHCPRCCTIFSDRQNLETHLAFQPPCILLDEVATPGGINEKQYRDLKSRKGLSKMTESEKWQLVYKILFPDTRDKIPDPYYNPARDRSEKISKFLVEELPSLVTKALESRFKTIGQNISRETLLEIVRQAQREIHQGFQQPSNPRSSGHQAGPSFAGASPIEADLYDDPFDSVGDSIGDDFLESLWDFCHDGLRETILDPVPLSSEAIRTLKVVTPVEHELNTTKRKSEDDISWSDSNNESVRGIAEPPAQKRHHEEASQTEHSDSCASSDLDRIDASNSDCDSMTTLTQAAADKYIIDVCSDISQRLERSVDTRALKSASKSFPTFIEAFAIKLGSEIPDQSDFSAMRFVHMHQQAIVSQLENKFHCAEIDVMDSRTLMGTMSLGEIMSRWDETNNKDPVTENPSDSLRGADDEEEVADQERDISAYSEIGKMIVKSAAFEWLIASLGKEASYHWDETQPRTMVDQIRQELLAQLPIGRISSKQPPKRHTISFKIPRGSLPFLSEDWRTQSTINPPMMIAERIVATSASAYSAQVSNVRQYMDQTWPLGGTTLLYVLQNFINGTGHGRASSAVEGNTEIKVMLKGFYLEVLITGTSYSIAEYGEQLAWLTAALQPAVSDLAMYVRPFMRRVDNRTPTKANGHSWVIEVWREGIDDADVTARLVREWQGEPKSPVIVRGFPTMRRPRDCPGIEVPSRLPANLLPSPLRERSGTRLLLNATGKVLQLIYHIKGMTVWHILSSARGICACRQRFLEDNDRYHLPCFKSNELRQHRHIITECSVVEISSRDAIPRMDPGLSSTMISQRGFSLLEATQPTSYSENVTESSDSLDLGMLSIPDFSEYGVGGPPDTDDAALGIIEEIAFHLVSDYRQYMERYNSAHQCHSNTKQCSPVEQQSITTQGGSQRTLRPAATQGSPVNFVRKRSAEQDDSESDEDSQRRPPQKKQKNNGCSKDRRIFACPFWKNDPDKHDDCFGKKLYMISRVKQHLSRSHCPQFYCDSCLVIFPTLELKQTHLRDERSQCKYDQTARLDGTTSEQRIELSRKPKKGLDELEQWFVVWDIIFPNLCRPSTPYLDEELSREMNNFLEFSERRGPEICTEVFRKGEVLDPRCSEEAVQQAVSQAIRSLFVQWPRYRPAILQSSKLEGSSSADVPGCQQSDERLRVHVSSLTGQSSTTDSGVVIESQSSAGLTREDINLPSYIPLPSDGRYNIGSHEIAGLEFHAPSSLNNGAYPSQLFVDAENPSLPIQFEVDHTELGQLGLDDFAEQFLNEHGFDFDANEGDSNVGDSDL